MATESKHTILPRDGAAHNLAELLQREDVLDFIERYPDHSLSRELLRANAISANTDHRQIFFDEHPELLELR